MFFNKLICLQKTFLLEYRKGNKQIQELHSKLETTEQRLEFSIRELVVQNQVKKRGNELANQQTRQIELLEHRVARLDRAVDDMKQDSKSLVISQTNAEIAHEFHQNSLKSRLFRRLQRAISRPVRRVTLLTGPIESALLRKGLACIGNAETRPSPVDSERADLMGEIATQKKLIELLKSETSQLRQNLKRLQSDFENKFNLDF